MSPSHREQRLRLYRAGNDRCPICLVPFTALEVERGEAVTLEHVPPQSFGPDSIAMCLTCNQCNSLASRAEQAAVEAKRGRGQKAQVDIDGLPTHTGHLRVSGGNRILLSMSGLRVSSDEFSESLLTGRIGLKWREPSARYRSVPWLKAAYLSVFSLLGVHGYSFADGEAIKPVRRQIMNPGEKIIPRFLVGDASGWRKQPGIGMSRRMPCWAVKMAAHLVLLPRSWDRSFYERTSSLPNLHLGDGLLWSPVKFGHARTARGTVQGGTAPDVLGEDLFGKGALMPLDGVETPVVLVDYSGQEVAMLILDGRLNGGGQ